MTIFKAFLVITLGVFAMYCDPILKQRFNINSSLSFSWSTNMSLNVWNENGEEDVIQLRPAGEIGGIRVPCLFDGYLQNDQDGRVAIFGCHGWSKIEIVILSKYSFGSTFNFLPQDKTTQEVMDPYLVTGDEENDKAFLKEDKTALLNRSKRSNFYFKEDEDYLDYEISELRVFSDLPERVYHNFTASFDESLLNKMNGNQFKCRQYVAKIIGLAQPYFLHPSLGLKIFFNVNEIMYIKNKAFKIDPEAHGLNYKDAGELETSHPLAIFTFTDDSDFWRGAAGMRKACDVEGGSAIVKWRSEDLKCARTFAHEYGHWFGLKHDRDEDSRDTFKLDKDCIGQGLMTDNVTKPERWSKCSQLRLERWYRKEGENCMKNVPSCGNVDDLRTPCICGKNKKERFCSGQYELCEDSTGICKDGNEDKTRTPKQDKFCSRNFIAFANALVNVRACDKEKDNTEWMMRNMAGCNKSGNVVTNFNQNDCRRMWCLNFREKGNWMKEWRDRCDSQVHTGSDRIYCTAIQNHLTTHNYLKCD